MIDIAILNAINPATSKVDWNGTPVDAYIRFLKSVEAPFRYTGYQVAEGEFPTSPEAHDAYVITGSPSGAYESDPWISELSQFIRDSYQMGKKLVGICFGHQILAHSLGGHVAKSEKGWGIGRRTFTVSSTKPWMTTPAGDCSLYFVHQDQVMALPPTAELLGGNEFCPNVLYTIKDQVLGIQGHPEISRRIMDDLLFGEFKEHLPQDDWATAVASVENGTPDNQLFAQWVVNFLQT